MTWQMTTLNVWYSQFFIIHSSNIINLKRTLCSNERLVYKRADKVDSSGTNMHNIHIPKYNQKSPPSTKETSGLRQDKKELKEQ